MTARRLQFASLLAGVIVLLGACDGGGSEPRPSTSAGGSSSAPDPGPGTPVDVKAGDLFLDPTEIAVPPGAVTFNYVNIGVQAHTLLIEGVPGFKLQVNTKGDADTGNVALERRGRYTLYCDIAGHRAAGMESMLVVR